MNWYDWYAEPWKKYAQFSGRARRKEYWTFFLVNNILVGGLLLVLGRAFGPVVLLHVAFFLATFIPTLACTARRLHDIDKSGWWLLIPASFVGFFGLSFVPGVGAVPFIVFIGELYLGVFPVGAIVLFVFMLLDGTPGANKYGVNPKESVGESVGTLGRQ